MTNVEFYNMNGEVWYTHEGENKKLEQFSDIVPVLYSKIFEMYPDAFNALNKEFAKIENQSYKCFRIVNRFIKCNFGNIDKVLDISSDDKFMFEEVPCPLRGECKLECVVCHPKFNSLLSDGELRVLELICDGKSRDEVADILCLSRITVKNHINKAISRVGVHSLAELVTYANSHNIFKKYGSNR